MFSRQLQPIILKQATQFPIVTILGPRQAGKTTLVKSLFHDKAYFNLEEPDTRALIASDPRYFFEANPNGAILDEIQRLPELLSYMESIVDTQQKMDQRKRRLQ